MQSNESVNAPHLTLVLFSQPGYPILPCPPPFKRKSFSSSRRLVHLGVGRLIKRMNVIGGDLGCVVMVTIKVEECEEEIS